jgi:hypothetical protein
MLLAFQAGPFLQMKGLKSGFLALDSHQNHGNCYHFIEDLTFMLCALESLAVVGLDS